MRQEHNKLICDRIPKIIRQTGRKCEVEMMSQSEYHQALLNKLIEEAKEAAGLSATIITNALNHSSSSAFSSTAALVKRFRVGSIHLSIKELDSWLHLFV